MPGARAGDVSESWFEDCFGFKEGVMSYFSTQRNFEMRDGDVLYCKRNKKEFHVGAFEVLSIHNLQQRMSWNKPPEDIGGLTFKNSIGDIRALHLDPANEGAVFQVMSQYNCLQMLDPSSRPENGITNYSDDKTQGPACALSCPAALVYRNYLCQGGNGQGYTNHIDCLQQLGAEVHNKIKGYWKMQNGFSIPSVGGIGTLSKMIEDDAGLAATLHSKLSVGIHWDTEVDSGTHRVCQVFSSAAPVAFSKKAASSEEWAPLARLLLAATFDATLTVAALLAGTRKQRVTVYLTAVGSGSFGNRATWIAEGIEKALTTHASEPLDVVLVHCAALPDGPYKALEEGRDASDEAIGAGGNGADKVADSKPPEEGARIEKRIMDIYKKFDANGDGDIDKAEFGSALRKLDENFFTDDVIATLIKAADADGDGKVKYAEFVAWVTGSDSGITARLLSSGSLAEDDEPAAAASERLPDEAYNQAVKLCSEWDKDGDGAISSSEMKDALGNAFPKWKRADIEGLVEVVDLNGDGMIPFDEFLQWLKIEPKERLSFEDFLHQFEVGAAGAPARHRGGAATTGSPRDGAAAREDDERGGGGGATDKDGPATKDTDKGASEENETLHWFSHPLLQKFGVTGDSCYTTRPDAVTVKVDKGSLYGSYSSRGRSSHSSSDLRIRERADGSYINLTAPTLKDTRGGVLLPLLQALAEAYGSVFEAYCEGLGKSGSSKAPGRLRLAPIQALDNYSLSIEHRPNVSFAAIALALARLSPECQDALAEASVELCCSGRSDDKDGHQEALEKVQASAGVLALPHAGRLKEREEGYKYLRKQNDEEARLVRLSAFMTTQRAISGRGYELTEGKVDLSQVEHMVRGTKVAYAKDADVGHAPLGRKTDLKTADELGWGSHATVMEASQKLAEDGKKVAALNAASAYHAGGGCSSGGRHALEEAWCTISTLYRSLLSVESVKTAGGEQHIPNLGCIVSPKVEIFREPTNDGYGFMSKPVELCGVLSIAMFNRNPGVSDSPLDSPSDPADYVMQTKAKLEAMMVSAIELRANVLVITDVGCGVFKNDPVVVGGCLGALLQKYDGHLEQIVMCCHKPEFIDACRRAFQGEDPREPCEDGKYCKKMGDPGHCARVVHPSETEDVCPPCVDTFNALVELVANPEPEVKPMCRYGKHCRTMTAEHRAKYDHPEPEPYSYSSMYGSSYGGSHGSSHYGSRYGGASHTSSYGGAGHTSTYGGGSSHYGSSYSGGAGGGAGHSSSYSGGAGGHSSSYSGGAGGHSSSYSGGAGGHSSSYSGGAGHSSSHYGSSTYGGGSSTHGASAGRTTSGGAGGTSHVGDSPTKPSGTGDSGTGGGSSSPSRTTHGSGATGGHSGATGGHSASYHRGASGAPGAGATGTGELADDADDAPAISRTRSRPVCKYGESCYNKSKKHLEEFAHPWLEGETPEEAKARRDLDLVHELLSLAKEGKWTNVFNVLRTHPDVVNIRPENRGYGLLHFACFQVEHETVKKLVEDYNADLKLLTRDNKTPLQVLELGISQTPIAIAMSSRAKDDALVRWIKRKLGEDDSPSTGYAGGGGRHGGTSDFSVTGTGLGSSDSSERTKLGGAKLEVCNAARTDIEGDYQELQQKKNDHPVYVKVGVTGCSRRYIYFHDEYKYGWVIDSAMDGGQPLAYLGGLASTRMSMHDNPVDKPLYTNWKVLQSSMGVFREDQFMVIKKLRR